ncbi:MAG: hypothetical protein WCC26_06215 [Terracidiphilus sp.]
MPDEPKRQQNPAGSAKLARCKDPKFRYTAAAPDAQEVSVDLRIYGKQLHSAGARLSHKKPVKRIPVEPRKSIHANRMFRGDGQFLETSFPGSLPNGRWLYGKIAIRQGVLDGNFRYRGCRKPGAISRIFNNATHRLRHLVGIDEYPKQDVSVEQIVHCRSLSNIF